MKHTRIIISIFFAFIFSLCGMNKQEPKDISNVPLLLDSAVGRSTMTSPQPSYELSLEAQTQATANNSIKQLPLKKRKMQAATNSNSVLSSLQNSLTTTIPSKPSFLFSAADSAFIALLSADEMESSTTLKDFISETNPFCNATVEHLHLDALSAQALAITKDYFRDEYRFKEKLLSEESYLKLLSNKTLGQLAALLNASNYLGIQQLEKCALDQFYQQLLTQKEVLTHLATITLPLPATQIIREKITQETGISAFWQIYAQSKDKYIFQKIYNVAKKTKKLVSNEDYRNSYLATDNIHFKVPLKDIGYLYECLQPTNMITIKCKNSPKITIHCNGIVQSFSQDDEGTFCITTSKGMYSLCLANKNVATILQKITIEQAIFLDKIRNSPHDIKAPNSASIIDSLPSSLQELVKSYDGTSITIRSVPQGPVLPGII